MKYRFRVFDAEGKLVEDEKGFADFQASGPYLWDSEGIGLNELIEFIEGKGYTIELIKENSNG